MPIRHFLKHKDQPEPHDAAPNAPPIEEDASAVTLEVPQFTLIRSDTHTEEVLSAPTFTDSDDEQPQKASEQYEPSKYAPASESRASRLFKRRANSTSGATLKSMPMPNSDSPTKNLRSPSISHRFSERLSMRRSVSSSNVPEDLPAIRVTDDPEYNGAEWEQRATILARENERQRSRPASPSRATASVGRQLGAIALRADTLQRKPSVLVSSRDADVNIQKAIHLHETGDLEASTKMFARLADPHGENNALSQVLYGLALRHGWGCAPDPVRAVTYLSAAASNAASIEKLALAAGMQKGGSAKGELVLAIFELANCFRHGWGVDKDAVAAQRVCVDAIHGQGIMLKRIKYYETAANLGDSDAMNETAWCYLEGYGCKKDKFTAAKYYQLAEAAGNKTLGNSWIWKDKYSSDVKSPPRNGKTRSRSKDEDRKTLAKGEKEKAASPSGSTVPA